MLVGEEGEEEEEKKEMEEEEEDKAENYELVVEMVIDNLTDNVIQSKAALIEQQKVSLSSTCLEEVEVEVEDRDKAADKSVESPR